MKPVYLDVCALCRPYDDQSYWRIHLETVAVHLILKAVQRGFYQMVASPVHLVEISAISNLKERVELFCLLEASAAACNMHQSAGRIRAEYLVRKGFGVADAAHLAYAEHARADFITCDDHLIKKCVKNSMNIWCGTPVGFCEKEELK